MIELFLIAMPSVIALLILIFRKHERLVLMLPAVAGVLHLLGTTALLTVSEKYNIPVFSMLGSDIFSRIILLVLSVLFMAASLNLNFWIPAARLLEHKHPTMRTPVFCAILTCFLSTMTLVLFSRNFGLLWVAVEATTLTSAPLIAYHRSPGALEAMWKYLLICSVGIGLALFGTFLLGVSFSNVHGLDFDALLAAKESCHPQYFKAAFLFCLAGYGLKMGLAPFHTWLPDAHSEAPSLVSVLLSGALLNCSFLGIIRVMALASGKDMEAFCSNYLLFFGILSLAVAACFILRQNDYKRMLAYSSVEHMGLIAILWSLGLKEMSMLHLICHSACKMILFLLAGNILLAYGTRNCKAVTGMFSTLPRTAFVWIAFILLICGMPPSPLFFTEFTLICSTDVFTGALVLFLLFAVFCGMTRIAMLMTMGKASDVPDLRAVPIVEKLTILPLLFGFIPLAIGIYLIFML